ncbi:MAG: hypothetical protein WC205_16885 [Opitutaceae bacterium]|jgi:hypothetical protein
MPTKIETSLTAEELMEFFKRCAQTKGGTTGPAIQALAAEFGVTISHDSANTFRKTAMQEYLDELKASARLAEDVAAVAKSGMGLADGAASAFAAKVFDAARRIDVGDIGSKEANNVSLAIARLKTGDRGDKKLAADLAALQQRMVMQQFDAAAAVLEHAHEIRLVIADNKLDAAAKTERIRKRLFGEKPADFKPVTTKGENVE